MTIEKDTSKIVFYLSIAVILLSGVIGVALYHINDRALMSKNISEAVAKGMDPLAVRCSYANPGDTICVAYASSTSRK